MRALLIFKHLTSSYMKAGKFHLDAMPKELPRQHLTLGQDLLFIPTGVQFQLQAADNWVLGAIVAGD